LGFDHDMTALRSANPYVHRGFETHPFGIHVFDNEIIHETEAGVECRRIEEQHVFVVEDFQINVLKHDSRTRAADDGRRIDAAALPGGRGFARGLLFRGVTVSGPEREAVIRASPMLTSTKPRS
jgi:hypothetical protein